MVSPEQVDSEAQARQHRAGELAPIEYRGFEYAEILDVGKRAYPINFLLRWRKDQAGMAFDREFEQLPIRRICR